ncbi:MAG: 2-oxoacid:acceptor oxidoreductase subunit alpha [Armatimonadetes bacterium]|nr:2-oxoacid:acceptor oxidoreductase subunit alpha [Armatimonadota bacterium]
MSTVKTGEPVLLSGNEAVAYGALAAGARFYAGYPITPSSEIAEVMARELPLVGGKFIQMEDEMASLGAVIGASLTGLKSFTATSGPGFSLMQEHVGFAAMAEVPCVVIDVMRGGPSTGLPTKTSQADVMQAKYGSHGDYPSVALVPSSVLECFTLTVKAFNISEKYRVPVVLLSDEIVGHMREKVVLPSQDEVEVVDRIKPTVPPEWYQHYQDSITGVSPMANFGEGYRFHVTGLTHDVYGFPTEKPSEISALLEKFKNKEIHNSRDLTMVEEFCMEDAKICIFAYGSVARSARMAVKILRQCGVKAGMLRPMIVWPFPKIPVENMLERANLVIVPEMNVGQLRKEVERLSNAQDKIHGINVLDPTFITAEQIVDKVRDLRAKNRRTGEYIIG